MLKILIAEDDVNIALALTVLLRRAISGTVIITVNDGKEAMQHLYDGDYALVISDWNMPCITGLELLSFVRANHHTRLLPFLMLTARMDVAGFSELANADITGYIGKPFDNDEFIRKVKELLSVDPGTP